MGAPSFCPAHLIVQTHRIISYHHSIKRRSYNNAECEGAPAQPLREGGQGVNAHPTGNDVFTPLAPVHVGEAVQKAVVPIPKTSPTASPARSER